MKQDYYETLGVSRGASQDEVRRAYRRMAKRYHPDVNNGDPEADARIKAINEAYEVLKDPKTRAAYDRFGHAGVEGVRRSAGGAPGAGQHVDLGDLGDIFEQFFGGFGGRTRGRRKQQAERGRDLRTKLRLQFEEAVFGATKKLEITRREVCEDCGGSGAASESGPIECTMCEGSGQVRRVQQSMFGSFVNVQTCPECRGRGRVVANPCPQCQGDGRRQRTRSLEVDIPAGVEDGTQIRLTGEGDHGRWGGPPGDLYVALEVASHPQFERNGNDVHLQVRVNPADAALGSEIEIPTLESRTTIEIPAGTQSGDTQRLPARGVPYLRRSGRGDLVVELFVTTPEKLSSEQRALLEQLRTTLPEAEVVERGTSFWERVKARFQ